MMSDFHFNIKKPFEYLIKEQELYLVPHIINYVGQYFKVDDGYELINKRDKNTIYHKYLCMYLIKENTKYLTLSEIGQYFFKDHSAIIHAHKRISNFLFYDNDVRNDVKQLQSKIDSKIDSIMGAFAEIKSIEESNNLNLNTFTTIKIKGSKKFLIGVNFTDEEIETIKGIFNSDYSKKYENTGLYFRDKYNNNKLHNGEGKGEKTKRENTRQSNTRNIG
jgi:hypothetical protein